MAVDKPGAERAMIFRSYSLPLPTCVESVEPSIAPPLHATRTTPTRATFPFKPASRMLLLQKSQTISLGRSYSYGASPPTSCMPRPEVCVQTINFRRPSCQTPLDWTPGIREKSTFPISINLPKDQRYWWIEEMSRIVEGKTRTQSEVPVVEDEVIEKVESEDEIDVIHETQVGRRSVSSTHQNFTLNKKNSLELQQKMKELREEVEQSKNLDPTKRLEMENALKRVDSVIDTDGSIDATDGRELPPIDVDPKRMNQSNNEEPGPGAIDQLRKAAVALAGGTLTATGVVLIPTPIPLGFVVAYGGLMVLSSEFESAKIAQNYFKGSVEQWLLEDEAKTKFDEDEQYYSRMWEKTIGSTTRVESENLRDINSEFVALIDVKRQKNFAEETGDAMKDAIKPFLKKMILGDDVKNIESKSNNDGDNNLKNVPSKNDDEFCEQSLPSLLTDLRESGCQCLPFDCEEDPSFDNGGNANNEVHESDPFNRIELSNDPAIRLFSRQTTPLESISDENKNIDSRWVTFDEACNAFEK